MRGLLEDWRRFFEGGGEGIVGEEELGFRSWWGGEGGSQGESGGGEVREG